MPPINSLMGRRVVTLRRLGNRIAPGFEGDRWLGIHLMIAAPLSPAEIARLHAAVREVMTTWTERLRRRREAAVAQGRLAENDG